MVCQNGLCQRTIDLYVIDIEFEDSIIVGIPDTKIIQYDPHPISMEQVKEILDIFMVLYRLILKQFEGTSS